MIVYYKISLYIKTLNYKILYDSDLTVLFTLKNIQNCIHNMKKKKMLKFCFSNISLKVKYPLCFIFIQTFTEIRFF